MGRGNEPRRIHRRHGLPRPFQKVFSKWAKESRWLTLGAGLAPLGIRRSRCWTPLAALEPRTAWSGGQSRCGSRPVSVFEARREENIFIFIYYYLSFGLVIKSRNNERGRNGSICPTSNSRAAGCCGCQPSTHVSPIAGPRRHSLNGVVGPTPRAAPLEARGRTSEVIEQRTTSEVLDATNHHHHHHGRKCRRAGDVVGCVPRPWHMCLSETQMATAVERRRLFAMLHEISI